MNTEDTFYRELEEILDLPAETICGTELLRDINWDSMSAVMFIAFADESYSKAINASLLHDGLTPAELYKLLHSST